MTQTKGFTANIYRDGYDCTINKMYGKNKVTIIDNRLPAMNEPTNERPAIKIVTRNLFGKNYTHAEPLEPGFYAFGGSFIYCSDSRFNDVATYPIPLHDRQMNLEYK